MLSGVAVIIFMTPADVVSTRLYNQSTDGKGRGVLYSGPIDCFSKVFQAEGIRGLYKGVTANYLRIGPHSVLMLTLWTHLREMETKGS